MASKRLILIGIAALLLAGFFARAAHRARAAAVGSRSQTMQFDGRIRRYILHVPASYATSNPGALVLVLHGATQSPSSAETMSHMSDLADKNNFLVVYPSGTSRNNDDRIPTWNAGGCCAYAMQNKINDVGFLSALIDQLRQTYSIDSKRVYATGISNGAMMSYRLACELSEKIAAIAPVEGAQDVPCQPTDRVSVLIFHGTDDHLVPFNGGTTPFQVGPKRTDTSVPEAIHFWVRQDGCNTTPAHTETPEVHTDFYTGCQAKTAVSLYAIQGGHHMWPGLSISGNQVPASDLIWQFFAAHPKP